MQNLLLACEPEAPWWASTPEPQTNGTDALTPAEAEVMRWLAEGRTNFEIGQLRGRSPATVRNQLHRIFRKLGACTRGEAVAIWRASQAAQASIHPQPAEGPGDLS